MLFGHDKLHLLHGPTPLMRLSNMSKDLGVDLYIKRDDMTPLALGGNKLRKLEYLVAEALRQGATTLLTAGAVQTNHGRLTAAVAARCGLKCTIVCVGRYPGEVSANLLLDRLSGARVVIEESDGRPEAEQLADLAQRVERELAAAGEKVYFIPVGGSNALGALGYYECALELTAQAAELGLGEARVVAAASSLGTYLGLFCGLGESGSPLKLTGVAISHFDSARLAQMMVYFNQIKSAFGLRLEAQPEDFDLRLDYVRGGYNEPDARVRQAIYHMARAEGIMLDPCYTGKAFAGLEDMLAEGALPKDRPIIFLHTGGMPALYTPHHRVEMERELLDGITLLKA